MVTAPPSCWQLHRRCGLTTVTNMRQTRFSESEDYKLIECVKVHPELYDTQHENNKNLYVKDKIWRNLIAVEMSRDVECCKKRWKDMKDHYYKLKRKQKLEAAASVPVKKTSWLLYEHLSFLSENSCRENETFGTEQIEFVKQENSCFSEDEVEKNSLESFYGFNNETFPDEHPSPSNSTPNNNNNNNNNNNDNYTSQLVAGTQLAKKRKELETIQENTERSLQLLEMMASKKTKLEADDDDVDMFLKSVAVTLKKLPPLLVAQAKMSILSTVSMLQLSAQSFRVDTFSAPENVNLSVTSSSSSTVRENIEKHHLSETTNYNNNI